MNGSSLRQRLFPSSGVKSSQERTAFAVESGSNLQVNAAYAKINSSSQQQSSGPRSNEWGVDAQDDPDDSLQRARQGHSQRSRLILGSRFASPKVEGGAGEGPSGIRPASAMSITPHISRTLAFPRGLSSNTRSTLIGSPSAPPKDEPDTPRLRTFSERRPAKSLRQRLDSGRHLLQDYCHTTLMSLVDEFQEPPTRDPMAVSGDLGESYFATQHDQLAPRAHSRSASVLSSVHGRPEDDISSIMMRGATDLRNAKFEVEELVRRS